MNLIKDIHSPQHLSKIPCAYFLPSTSESKRIVYNLNVFNNLLIYWSRRGKREMKRILCDYNKGVAEPETDTLTGFFFVRPPPQSRFNSLIPSYYAEVRTRLPAAVFHALPRMNGLELVTRQ